MIEVNDELINYLADKFTKEDHKDGATFIQYVTKELNGLENQLAPKVHHVNEAWVAMQ